MRLLKDSFAGKPENSPVRRGSSCRPVSLLLRADRCPSCRFRKFQKRWYQYEEEYQKVGPQREKTADSCCEATLPRSEPSMSMRFSRYSNLMTSSCWEMRLILRFSQTATATKTTRLLRKSQKDTPQTQVCSWMRFMAKQLRLRPMPQVATMSTERKLFLQLTAAALSRKRLFVVISPTANFTIRQKSYPLSRKANTNTPKHSWPTKSSSYRIARQKVSLGVHSRVCRRAQETQPYSGEKAQSRLVQSSMVMGAAGEGAGVGVGAKVMRIHWQQAMEKMAQRKVTTLRMEANSRRFLSTRCLCRFYRCSSSSEESDDSILQTCQLKRVCRREIAFVLRQNTLRPSTQRKPHSLPSPPQKVSSISLRFSNQTSPTTPPSNYPSLSSLPISLIACMLIVWHSYEIRVV